MLIKSNGWDFVPGVKFLNRKRRDSFKNESHLSIQSELIESDSSAAPSFPLGLQHLFNSDFSSLSAVAFVPSPIAIDSIF